MVSVQYINTSDISLEEVDVVIIAGLGDLGEEIEVALTRCEEQDWERCPSCLAEVAERKVDTMLLHNPDNLEYHPVPMWVT